jgi:hypothetical protein
VKDLEDAGFAREGQSVVWQRREGEDVLRVWVVVEADDTVRVSAEARLGNLIVDKPRHVGFIAGQLLSGLRSARALL